VNKAPTEQKANENMDSKIMSNKKLQEAKKTYIGEQTIYRLKEYFCRLYT
jgi:hypothetical protein